MLITEKLEHTKFSNSEQIIVDYLKKEQLNIENKSTTQIANETFSSKSTIVQVAKRLDFSGWNEFKKAYLEELRYLFTHQSTIDANFPFNEHDHYLAIAQKIAKLEQEAIEDTLSLINFSEIKKAIKMLQKASSIHIFAVSNNLLISEEFCYNLTRIKKRATVHSRYGEAIYSATLMEPEDCAIVISYSGETHSLLKVVEILYQKKIPILLITSIGENSMVKLSNCILRISTREKLYSKIATFANDTSITYLLDVLYSCLFQEKYHYYTQLRKETSQIFEAGRHSEIPIIKEF